MFPPRPRKASYQTDGHRIDADHEHNWNGFGHCLGGEGAGRTNGREHLNPTLDQISGESGHPVISPVSKSVFDGNVSTLDETSFGQAPAKRGQKLRALVARE
jgi:hypothetical protein